MWRGAGHCREGSAEPARARDLSVSRCAYIRAARLRSGAGPGNALWVVLELSLAGQHDTLYKDSFPSDGIGLRTNSSITCLRPVRAGFRAELGTGRPSSLAPRHATPHPATPRPTPGVPEQSSVAARYSPRLSPCTSSLLLEACLRRTIVDIVTWSRLSSLAWSGMERFRAGPSVVTSIRCLGRAGARVPFTLISDS